MLLPLQESADRICRCLDVGLDIIDVDIIAVEEFGGIYTCVVLCVHACMHACALAHVCIPLEYLIMSGVLVEMKDFSNSKDVKLSVKQPVKGNQLL